jgi:hypothetical protein
MRGSTCIWLILCAFIAFNHITVFINIHFLIPGMELAEVSTASPLPQTLIQRLVHRIEEVTDDSPPSGFDLGAEVHAGDEVDPLAVDVQPAALEREQCGEDGTAFFVVDGISGHGFDLGVHVAVAGEREGFQFDGAGLAGLHEADVFVVDDDFGCDLGIFGHDDHQHLGRGDHAHPRDGAGAAVGAHRSRLVTDRVGLAQI